MVVQAQQVKQDEQHPLLKVDTEGSGGGDTGRLPRPPSTVITPGWNVACVPKRSWFDRCPEYISACWMTLILLGITFLVFYALGMSAYRRQSLIIVKCNNSKPEANVYFHTVIPRGSYFPYYQYSEYISSLATEYPFLHFHVHFLTDDSHDFVYGLKHSRLFKRFSQPIFNGVYPEYMNERDKQELKMFQQRYRNVNITIMTLSHYMSRTPLRCKWKTIPIHYLPFYARIFAVWEYGGIGLDLISLNNKFNDNQTPDSRITAILRQHNDGVEEKKYLQTLNTLNNHEQTDSFNIFYHLMNNLFAKTDALIDGPVFDLPVIGKTNNNVATLSRNFRNKRENSNNITDKTSILENKSVVGDANDTKTSDIKESNIYRILINSTLNKAKVGRNNSQLTVNETYTAFKNNTNIQNSLNATEIGNETPHVILFYEFSLLPDGIIGPSYAIPQIQPYKLKISRKPNRPLPLSITYDGHFVAATSRHHPFLGHVLSTIFTRFSPRLVIENALSSKCHGTLNKEEYCDNIYLLD